MHFRDYIYDYDDYGDYGDYLFSRIETKENDDKEGMGIKELLENNEVNDEDTIDINFEHVFDYEDFGPLSSQVETFEVSQVKVPGKIQIVAEHTQQ